MATPSDLELNAVPHHFIGHLSVSHYYNVSGYENDVLDFLKDYYLTKNNCLLVGGSGLYIDAVCKGIDDLPDPDESLREMLKDRLKNEGLESLKTDLKKLDPEYYQIVDNQNPNRILRALEICLTTGKTFTQLRLNAHKPRPFNILKLGLNRPRHELYEQIGRRVDEMIASGLVEEVKSLVYHRHHNALNTVGYKEIFSYLDGSLSLDEAVDKIKTNTRRYAKRQLTWFKRDPAITWFHPDEVDKMLEYIESRTS